jgi:hypothetical protein
MIARRSSELGGCWVRSGPKRAPLLIGVLMSWPVSNLDLAELREESSRAVNRIRSMIPNFLALLESERDFIKVHASGQNYLPELESDSMLRSEGDRT